MNINLQAVINTLGYGYVGYNFLKELYKKTNVTLFEIAPIDDKQFDLAHKLSFTQNPSPILNGPSIKIWHQNNVHTRIGKGRHFGFPIFELNKLKNMEKYSINSCDAVIVCSNWAKNVLENNGVKIPIYIVPLGYDPDIFSAKVIKRPGPTIFFNCGKWERRKGHDVILQCFESAFSPSDNVELWMMCENPFPFAKGKEWEQIYKNSKLSSKIKLIPRQESHENVYYIMSKTDCGIFPARAEGWNLELLEMMACGKEIIATDYSGHTEFISDSVYKVSIDSLEVAIDNVWFDGFGEWAHIGNNQIEQIISHMRHIHKLKTDNGYLDINKNNVLQAQKYTWEKSADKLIKVL